MGSHFDVKTLYQFNLVAILYSNITIRERGLKYSVLKRIDWKEGDEMREGLYITFLFVLNGEGHR